MIIVVLGRISQIILALITVRVATSILPPEEMGRIFLISSTVALYASILISPVGMFINRRIYTWNIAGKIRNYFRYFWLYLLIVSLTSTASITIFVKIGIFEFHTELIWLSFLIFSSLIISTINLLLIPSLNLLGYRVWFVYLTLATSVASLIMAFYTTEYVRPSAEYWLVGLLAGQLLLGLIGGKVFYSKIQRSAAENGLTDEVTQKHLRQMWNFAWPIMIGAILVWGQTQSYRFLMASTLGLAEVGLFVAGYGISAGIIAGFESVFTAYFQPIFYKQLSEENITEQGRAWSRYAGAILPSLILVGFCVVAMAPELTGLMLGSGYSKSAQFVQWGVIAEMARVASGVYGMVAHAKMNTRLLLIPNVLGFMTSIVLILCLMPQYGTTGIGIALALAGLTVFITTYQATRGEMVTKLPYKEVIHAIGFGILLIGISFLSRQIIETKGILATLTLLGLLAIVYLLGQYLILTSTINKGKE